MLADPALADQLLAIIDERIGLAMPDRRMALDWARGTVVSVTPGQHVASALLSGASQPTVGIVLHAGLGRVPVPGDEVVVERRGDGLHLMMAILGELPADPQTGLLSITVRSTGNDDAGRIIQALGDAQKGWDVILPDQLYNVGTPMRLFRSGVGLVGSGVGLYGATNNPSVGTRLKWVGVAGATMLTVAPLSIAANEVINAPRVRGLALDGSSGTGVNGAARGLVVYACEQGHFADLWLGDCYTSQLDVGNNATDIGRTRCAEVFFDRIYCLADGAADAVHWGGYIGSASSTATTLSALHLAFASALDGVVLKQFENDTNSFSGTVHTRVADGGRTLDLRGMSNYYDMWPWGAPWTSSDGNPTGGGVIVRADPGTSVSRRSYGHIFWPLHHVDSRKKIETEAGARVTYLGEWGQTNAHQDLRTLAQIVDDFITGGTTSGTIGELRWTLSGNNPATSSILSAEVGRLGIQRITSGAVAGDEARIHLDHLLHPSDTFEVEFKIRPVLADADTQIRVGLFGDVTTLPDPSGGIWIEKLYGDTQWFGVCRSGGVQTRSGSMGASSYEWETDPTANLWTTLRISRRSPTEIHFSVNSGVNGLGETVATNIPTAQLRLALRVRTQIAAARSLDVDAVKYLALNLDRV